MPDTREGSPGSPHVLVKTERGGDSNRRVREKDRVSEGEDALHLETGGPGGVGPRPANQKVLTVSARGESRVGA